MPYHHYKVTPTLEIGGTLPWGFDALAAREWLTEKLLIVSPEGNRYRLDQTFWLGGKHLTMRHVREHLQGFRMTIPPDVVDTGVEVVFDFEVREEPNGHR